MGFAFFQIYLVLAFLRPWEIYPSLQSLPIISLASVAAAGATLISMALGRRPTGRAPQAYLAVLFMLWVVFSFVAATRWLGGVPGVMGSLQPSLLIFFLAFLNVDTIDRLRSTAVTLALVAVFLVGESTLAYHFGYQSGTFLLLEGATQKEVDEATATNAPASEAREGTVVRIRNLGSLADPNDFAQALVTISAFLFALRRPGRRIRNALLVWTPAAAIMYGVALTRSRGGLVALIALLFYGFRHRLGRVLSVTIATTAALGLFAVGFTGGRTMSMDESSEGRVAAWYEGLQMLKSAPIWGVGYGNFADFNTLVAHNSFVHCFAETGLVGYFLWLWLIALTFAEAAALAKRGGLDQESAEMAAWGRALHLALIAFLTAAFFLSRTYSPVLFLILGLGAALSDMARRQGRVADNTSLLRWVPRILALEVVSILAVRLAVQGLSG